MFRCKYGRNKEITYNYQYLGIFAVAFIMMMGVYTGIFISVARQCIYTWPLFGIKGAIYLVLLRTQAHKAGEWEYFFIVWEARISFNRTERHKERNHFFYCCWRYTELIMFGYVLKIHHWNFKPVKKAFQSSAVVTFIALVLRFIAISSTLLHRHLLRLVRERIN